MGAPVSRGDGGGPSPAAPVGVEAEADGPLCPSAPCAEGSALLGVVQRDGRVSLLPQVIPLDAAFVAKAHEGRRPTSRFRFTAPCQAGGCAQWRDGGCSVGARAAALAAPGEAAAASPPFAAGSRAIAPRDPGSTSGPAALPACGIRPRCRWWLQEGPAACGACPEVVTDTRPV